MGGGCFHSERSDSYDRYEYDADHHIHGDTDRTRGHSEKQPALPQEVSRLFFIGSYKD